MKKEDFYEGMHVKQYNEKAGYTYYGHIVEIDENSIWVAWNETIGLTEVLEYEYESLKKY